MLSCIFGIYYSSKSVNALMIAEFPKETVIEMIKVGIFLMILINTGYNL